MPRPPLWQTLVRLPGRVSLFSRLLGATSSLWLDDACLLLADSSLLRDRYRRFYYADIQALQLQRTARGLAYNIILLFAAFLSLLGFLASSSRGARIFWLASAAGSAILLTLNLLRGPTCRCRVQTAVGRTPLASLSRARAARAAFARIRERIAAAQGTLPPAEATVERMNAYLAQSARERAVGMPHPATARG